MANESPAAKSRLWPPLRSNDVVGKVEATTVLVLQFLIILTVTLSTVMLFVLFANGIRIHLPDIDSAHSLQDILQTAYSGVLMVLLGLELLTTLRAYFTAHHLQIEVILVVAMIAVGRRIIEVDFAKLSGFELLGLGALVVCLAVSYFLVKKTHAELAPVDPHGQVPGGATESGSSEP
jgi:uncharacterized membrane protein (DUF373 family)